jgi:hypothetical protein
VVVLVDAAVSLAGMEPLIQAVAVVAVAEELVAAALA